MKMSGWQLLQWQNGSWHFIQQQHRCQCQGCQCFPQHMQFSGDFRSMLGKYTVIFQQAQPPRLWMVFSICTKSSVTTTTSTINHPSIYGLLVTGLEGSPLL